MGYHINEIEKGVLGESSKIIEEVAELHDAEEQGNKVLALCELADLIGAIDHYLEKKFPGITVEDLKKMSDATRRAFEDGSRKR